MTDKSTLTDCQYPSISLITPSFNQAQFLEKTISSVLSQDYPNLEYIIVDGGSDDDSLKIIESFAPDLSYWISEPDNGQAHAINKGFSVSTGSIMGWLNSDDILMPGALKVMGELFAQFEDIDWITGGLVTINKHGYATFAAMPIGRLRTFIRKGWYHSRGLGFINQESTFWRRNLWNVAGGTLKEDKHYAMDFDLWQRFAAHAPLFSAQTLVGAFRQQSQQKTATMTNYFAEIGIHPRKYTQRKYGLAHKIGRSIYTELSTSLTYKLHYNRANKRWEKHVGLLGFIEDRLLQP